MYEELKGFLQQTDIKDQFIIKFIDLDQENLSDYEKEFKIINEGYQLPITFVQGEPIFSGKVDQFKAYLTLKKVLQESHK